MRKPIVILRAGDVAPPVAEHRGQFPEWIERTVGEAWTGPWAVYDVRTDAPLPRVSEAAAFVMTGSSSSVTERTAWMLRSEAYVREIAAAEVPFFGICFGHQLAAQALGGEVGRNPKGREIGTVRVRRLAEDAIFGEAQSGAELLVNATHVDTVARLPAGARVLAASELEGTQAFAVGVSLRCVQFHPEIDGDAMRRYVAARAGLIEAEGGDPARVMEGVREAESGAAVLRSFVRAFVKG